MSEIAEDQHRFMPERGTRNAKILKMLVEPAIEHQREDKSFQRGVGNIILDLFQCFPTGGPPKGFWWSMSFACI